MNSNMADALSTKKILRMWLPLALSWLLMAAEGPLLSAFLARMPDAEINLAAYGGIVWPVALIVEAPVIMLLAASTALSNNREAYTQLRRFTMILGAGLTILHALIAFTPLYDVLAVRWIGAPQEIVEPARRGLQVMLPWTWAIGYRRFQQGVMIRFGHSEALVVGTGVRLLTDLVVLMVGLNTLILPGVVIGAGAQTLGASLEAAYSGWRVRRVVRAHIHPAAAGPVWQWKEFGKFYFPLALTSVINLVWQPIGSAALSRMPQALASLAVWPVLSGLVFISRSAGMAFNEVVVALLGEKGAVQQLRKVAVMMAAATSLTHLIFAITPLSNLWFGVLTGLPPDLVFLARVGFLIALPLPALSVAQSWYQGALVFGKRTRGVPEAVTIYLISVSLLLSVGVLWGKMVGLYFCMGALGVAQLIQTGWLRYKSRQVFGWLAHL